MSVSNHQDTKWFTEKVMAQMDDNQHYFVTLVAFKLIYSDARIDKQEVEFLPELCEFLGDNDFLVYVFTTAAYSIDLSKMPKVEFSKDLKTSVLKYLIQIAISDQDLHKKEMALIKEIADWLNYTPGQFSALLDMLGIRWS